MNPRVRDVVGAGALAALLVALVVVLVVATRLSA